MSFRSALFVSAYRAVVAECTHRVGLPDMEPVVGGGHR